MRKISAAVAAIALMAGAAHAQGQGQGQGKGNDKGGKPAAAAQGGGNDRGGGNGRGNGNGNAKAERGNSGQGGGNAMAGSMRGSDNRGGGGGNGNAMRDDRGNDRAERGNSGKADRGNQRQGERAVQRANADNGNRGRGNDNRTEVVNRRSDDRGSVVRVRDFEELGRRGLIDGCPPGLAKKNPPCVPPGQARGDQRGMFEWNRPDFWGLSRLDGGRYFYDDGYLVRLGDGGRIGGYVPLLGGALSIGQPWPTYYEPFALPQYYESYYGLGPYQSYRYADDVIYGIDPETAAITSIAALLTGDDFTVGRPMPLGYDIYNVPYEYRDRYVDGPDSLYRYSDGYVYQVDPETRLIAAAIELLAS